MSFKNYTVITFLQFGIIIFVANAISQNESGQLSIEDDWEIEKQLKAINKPAVKSIKTSYGDIIDCIKIDKQLAFDHPLLKNHTIQMKPQGLPSKMFDKDIIRNLTSEAKFERMHCPKGSVPIKRVSKEDLIIDKYIRSMVSNYYINNNNNTGYQAVSQAPYVTSLNYKGDFKGISAHISPWSVPNVQGDQFSSSSMGIVRGFEDFDVIEAGWIVYPSIFKDTKTRIYSFWIGESVVGSKINGCYNTLCPGFIQVSRDVHVGNRVWPLSTYNGEQYSLVLSLSQDSVTGDWWLKLGDHLLGYWPKSIFRYLQEGGQRAFWGGEAGGRRNEPSVPMGSGHFANEGFKKAAFIRKIKVIKETGEVINPVGATLYNSDDPKCYSITKYLDAKTSEHAIFFGGPGGCTE